MLAQYFSFYLQECDTGIYICMNTFIGFGKKFVEHNYKKTGNAVYLHLKRVKKQVRILA